MPMNDAQKLKEVVRLTRVPPEKATAALDQIRSLVAVDPPAPAPEPEPDMSRKARRTRDRLERNAQDRSQSSEDEAS